jgi:integrase
MRIGEVLSLKVKDINTKAMSFSVHCSKNNISRYVPISPSLASVVDYYLSCIPHRGQPDQYLFLSHYTISGYSYSAVKYMFKKFFALAGVQTPQGKLPRIHDIRHTFCTMSLNNMLSTGMNLYVAVPILSAYVGHTNLIDTEKYIHLTEHGYDNFIRKQKGLQSLIPEVANDED